MWTQYPTSKTREVLVETRLGVEPQTRGSSTSPKPSTPRCAHNILSRTSCLWHLWTWGGGQYGGGKGKAYTEILPGPVQGSDPHYSPRCKKSNCKGGALFNPIGRQPVSTQQPKFCQDWGRLVSFFLSPFLSHPRSIWQFLGQYQIQAIATATLDS